MSENYDYKDFVYTLAPESMWANVGHGAYSEAGAKLEFWQNFQGEILRNLQEEIDDGWQPIGEVGPAGISISTRTEFFKWNTMGWIFYVLSGFVSYTIGWIILPFLMTSSIARPTGFRVGLRRLKR